MELRLTIAEDRDTLFSKAIPLLIAAFLVLPNIAAAQKLISVREIGTSFPRVSRESSALVVSGQITYADGVRSAFLQDATGGILIRNPRVIVELKRGQRVRVQGPLVEGGWTPTMEGAQVTLLPPNEATPIAPLAFGDDEHCTSLRNAYQFIQLRGVVRSALQNPETHARAEITLFACHREIHVFLRTASAAQYENLVDATVRVQGVLRVRTDAMGKPVIYDLLAESIDDVMVEQAAPLQADLPLQTVSALIHKVAATRERFRRTGSIDVGTHRVRLRGYVQHAPQGLVLRDATSSIRMEFAGDLENAFLDSQPQTITGFLDVEAGNPILKYCQPLKARDLTKQARPMNLLAPERVLTSVSAIRHLTEAEIDANLRVKLHGIITYSDVIARDTFFQDATGGIFVFAPTGGKLDVKAGQEVELEGLVSFGGFAPVVTEPKVKVLGERPLPPPLRIPMEELFTGVADSQLVSAIGTVRNIETKDGHLRMEMVWGVHRYIADIASKEPPPSWLLNSRVQITGVCGAISNFKRQIMGIQLSVPGFASITRVGSEAQKSPQLEPISHLLAYSSQVRQEGRARVRGKIVFTTPTGPTYLSDASGGLLVKTHAAAALKTGDWVEVIGTPHAGAFAPELEDGSFTRIANLEPPKPQIATYRSILDKGEDANFVQITGYLVDDTRGVEGETLMLQEGDHFFEGRLLSGRLPHFTKGSIVRVSGLTALRVDGSGQFLEPTSFSILLRSPLDLELMRSSPWWTPAKLRSAGLIASIFGLSASIWMIVLGRQVKRRTQQLQSANEKLAFLADRDGLTGAMNRRKFDELVIAECQRAHRLGSTLALIMIDIDYFKGLNDQYGHQRGDDCLLEVVRALRFVLRQSSNCLARYGGEEFALLLPATELESAAKIAERMREAITSLKWENLSSPLDHILSASLGVAAISAPPEDAGAVLIRMADEALYLSKKHGRNRVTLHQPVTTFADPAMSPPVRSTPWALQPIVGKDVNIGHLVIDGD